MLDIPTGDASSSYYAWWDWAAAQLSLHLVGDSNPELMLSRPLGMSRFLKESLSDYRNGERRGAVNLAHVIDMLYDLEYLEGIARSTYQKYQANLGSNITKNYSYLTGLWFEIRIAAMLVEQDLEFTQPDPPDFVVSYRETQVAIECHAPRPQINDDLHRKIYRAITDKDRAYRDQTWIKNYSSILALDATWIVRAQGSEMVGSHDTLSDKITSGVTSAVNLSSFDLVILFWFGHAIVENRNKRMFHCVYASAASGDDTRAILRDKMLQGFEHLRNVQTILPQMPTN